MTKVLVLIDSKLKLISTKPIPQPSSRISSRSIYNSARPTSTFLDRGNVLVIPCSRWRVVAEFSAGLVRYDGRFVDIDLTSLNQLEEGRLIFQLLNSDADSGSQVTVRPY